MGEGYAYGVVLLNIEFEMRIEQKDLEEFLKDYQYIQGKDQKLKVMAPVRFGFTTDYAASLELGTGPLRDMQPLVHHGAYTYESIWKEIDEWAYKKLEMHDKAHRENFVTGVVNRMWEEGMYQHPYFRPALLWLTENMQAKFDEGWTLYEIADEAMRIANQIIMDKGIPFQGNLQRSATIDSLTFDAIYQDAEANTREDDWFDKLYDKA